MTDEHNVSDAASVVSAGPASEKSGAKSSVKSPGALRTISEVATLLGVKQHVLRFWETKFSAVRPLKRGGGRRYYRPEDVALLQAIHDLLYVEGYTIKGVQKLIRAHGKKSLLTGVHSDEKAVDHAPVSSSSVQKESVPPAPSRLTPAQKDGLQDVLQQLYDLRRLVVSEDTQVSG